MANLTPDAKERGYLLPPGCKDLIDVLQRARRQEPPPIKPGPREFTQTRSEPVEGRLSEMEEYLIRVKEPEKLFCILHVTPPEPRLTLSVFHRGIDGAISASVFVEIGSALEKTVQRFFAKHGLDLPEQEGAATNPLFLPGLPIHLRYNLEPLPAGTAQMARLISAFFAEVAGLDEQAEVAYAFFGAEEVQ